MGTVNAFNRLKKEERKAIFSLSKSFRFNQHIANLASEIANVANNNKEEVIEIKGIDLENEIKESEVIKIYDNGKMNVLDNLNKDGERIAILAVKNQTLLTLVFELIDKYRGISFYIVGRDTFFSTIEKEYNEHYVNSGGKGKVKELLKMAEWNEDSEMMSIYQTILNYGKFLPEKIENVKKNWSKSIEDAKVIFCTIHRSKGLEFENVRLVDDHKVGSRGKEKSAKELMDAIYEKYRLYYVAVTRAKKTLWFPLSLCKEFKIRNYRGPSSRYPYRKFDCTLTKFLNAKRVINID